MDALTCFATRRSPRALDAPGPSEADLIQAIDAAQRSPDHGRLRPWRFIVLEGDGRTVLADAMADYLQRQTPDVAPARLAAERAKALRAPTIVVVAAAMQPDHPKIPALEQILAAGAAAQTLCLIFHAQGYGAVWKSGAATYDDGVKAALGLTPTDAIVALIYVGTPSDPEETDLVERPRWPENVRRL